MNAQKYLSLQAPEGCALPALQSGIKDDIVYCMNYIACGIVLESLDICFL